MDTEILKSNKIPGSEQLTRPEEIQALSKFLGKVRKEYDDSLKLEDTLIDATGKFPKTKELPQERITLDDRRNVKLSDNVVKISVEENIELETEKDKLNTTEKTTELENNVESLKTNKKETNLSESIEELVVSTGKVKFPKTIETLSINKEKEKLSTIREDLVNQEKVKELGNSVERLATPKEPTKLEDLIQTIDTQEQDSLDGTLINSPQSVNPEPTQLGDSILARPDSDNPEPGQLGDSILARPDSDTSDNISSLDTTKKETPGNIHLGVTGLDNTLESSPNNINQPVTQLDQNKELNPSTTNTDSNVSNLSNYTEQRPDSTVIEVEALDNTLENRPGNKNWWINKILKLLNSPISGDDLYRNAQTALDSVGEIDSIQRIQALMSFYLAGTKTRSITKETADKFRQELAEIVYNKSSKIVRPDYNITGQETNGYLRYIAEQAGAKLGKNEPSNTREQLINEALSAAVVARDASEKLMGQSPYLLPGSTAKWQSITTTVVGNVLNSGVVSYSGSGKNSGFSFDWTKAGQLVNNLVESIDSPTNINDLNKSVNTRYDDYKRGRVVIPSHVKQHDNDDVEDFYYTSENELRRQLDTLSYQNRTNRIKEGDSTVTTTSNPLVDPAKFYQTLYTGTCLTISDLCLKDPKILDSGSSLTTALQESEYITTRKRIYDNGFSNNGLDFNSYWEVTMEPYAGKQNGGWSFLPDIREINTLNEIKFGACTRYNKWIPFSGFDISKSKSTSKSIGLYDGEINVPSSVEFTNELRFTVVDDVYKSWRTYFQNCSDVAVYNSEPHTQSYYTTDGTKMPTIIDKTQQVVSFYQNVAFNIRLYVMNPQLATVKFYNLLCVLRDFSEDNSGDFDGGGTELTVNFSVVGELPTQDIFYPIIKSGNVRDQKDFISGYKNHDRWSSKKTEANAMYREEYSRSLLIQPNSLLNKFK